MSDWLREPPDAWERRLREISPVTDRLAHLRFRYRAPRPWWNWPADGVWEIYSCRPRVLAPPDRAAQFDRRWQDMPQTHQQGRKAAVTSYQYFMWHTHGVDASRFWVLQGPGGGTPAMYTDRERAYLDGVGAVSLAPPLGFFPPCDFDERAVKHILARDRFVEAGKNFDRLQAMDSALALRHEDEANARLHRETYLDWWAEVMGPCKEFMKTQLFKAAAEDVLPPAPKDLPNRLAQWKEHFIEHGHVIGAESAAMRQVQVDIPGAIHATPAVTAP